MLGRTHYTISKELLQAASSSLPEIDARLALNEPTGDFFHDPWVIKSEYKDTVWEQVLNSITCDKGEARLIKLIPGEAYPSHADIDDRWHLTIQGNHSYLIDLETHTMHPTEVNGRWYIMNAGCRHTAANFGSEDRIQLVVRQLLPQNILKDPIEVFITLKDVVMDRRFIFDDVISPWLNLAFKRGIVSKFNGQDLVASLTIELDCLDELEEITKEYFNLTIDP
jgi:Aspartyl/Asparaginyl beta-hydroxylase